MTLPTTYTTQCSVGSTVSWNHSAYPGITYQAKPLRSQLRNEQVSVELDGFVIEFLSGSKSFYCYKSLRLVLLGILGAAPPTLVLFLSFFAQHPLHFCSLLLYSTIVHR